ncbi:MAG: hypothetical protein JJT94_01575 [Bernardetiaceae bacterium]|nr:hypothetical protein [Bernardetiaceae bacterium]
MLLLLAVFVFGLSGCQEERDMLPQTGDNLSLEQPPSENTISTAEDDCELLPTEVGYLHNEALRNFYQTVTAYMRSMSYDSLHEVSTDVRKNMMIVSGLQTLKNYCPDIDTVSLRQMAVEMPQQAPSTSSLAEGYSGAYQEVYLGLMNPDNFSIRHSILNNALSSTALNNLEKGLLEYSVAVLDSSFSYWDTEVDNWNLIGVDITPNNSNTNNNNEPIDVIYADADGFKEGYEAAPIFKLQAGAAMAYFRSLEKAADLLIDSLTGDDKDNK